MTLTKTQLEQLYNYVKYIERFKYIERLGWDLGDEKQFQVRHEAIKKWLNEQIDTPK